MKPVFFVVEVIWAAAVLVLVALIYWVARGLHAIFAAILEVRSELRDVKAKLNITEKEEEQVH